MVAAEDRARLPDQAVGDIHGRYAASLEELNLEDQRTFDCKDLELWDTGCFSYWHRRGTPGPQSRGGPEYPDALSPEQTREIAERFLHRSGLLPARCTFDRVVPAITQNAEGIEVYGIDKAPRRVLSRRVVYAFQVEGIALGDFSVDVNGNGEVYRVSRRTPNITPLARYPILSPDEARTMIPQGLLASHIWVPATAVIDGVSLSYSREWNYADIIQPVYTFSGTAHGEDGAADTFVVTWPAVRPAYLQSPVVGN